MTPDEFRTRIDPTTAPAWGRVAVDDQQQIEAVFGELDGLGEALIERYPDDDPQLQDMLGRVHQVGILVFDLVVDENLNEPENVVLPNDEG